MGEIGEAREFRATGEMDVTVETRKVESRSELGGLDSDLGRAEEADGGQVIGVDLERKTDFDLGWSDVP